MNKMIIIGNLTRDPEYGTTRDGVNYTRFTVAVKKSYHRENEPDADFVRVTAWNKLADSCRQYLSKGKKVYVCGPATASGYTGQDGRNYVNLEVRANEVEFLTPRGYGPQPENGPAEFTPVDEPVPDFG